jgi:hypothetical protein
LGVTRVRNDAFLIMKTKYWLELTKPEIEHLNSLIRMNEQEGSYYGSKMQYWVRSKRIATKLDNISKTCYMFQVPIHTLNQQYTSKDDL